jgi:hypothetical protein
MIEFMILTSSAKQIQWSQIHTKLTVEIGKCMAFFEMFMRIDLQQNYMLGSFECLMVLTDEPCPSQICLEFIYYQYIKTI